MKKDEDWDINYFLYLYTVVLNRTEEEFYKSTPRKLFAMIDQHIKFNSFSDKKDNRKKEYIDHTSYL